jgi:hypothetical protein
VKVVGLIALLTTAEAFFLPPEAKYVIHFSGPLRPRKGLCPSQKVTGPSGQSPYPRIHGGAATSGGQQRRVDHIGTISGPAWEAAKQVRETGVLVDGHSLASLMIEHGVGVNHDVIKIPKVDMDCFEKMNSWRYLRPF